MKPKTPDAKDMLFGRPTQLAKKGAYIKNYSLLPIMLIAVFGSAFGLYSMFRAALFSPDVSYTRKNPEPWQDEKLAPNSNDKWQLAVDVGTGTGQVARSLQPYFNKIIGFDSSEAQLNEAIKSNSFSNIEYKLSAAESLPISDNSVDLLTACQCMHWFDIPVFFKEVQRVLKANGVFAAIARGRQKMYSLDREELTEMTINDNLRKSLKPYSQDGKMQLWFNGYKDIEFPFHDVSRESFYMEHKTTAERIIDFVKSWSSFQTFLESDPSKAEFVLSDMRQAFISHFKESDLSKIEVISGRTYFLILGRKN
ncbi:putative methyltransferase-like protein [Dinothrombium tinctorium]|uniref:Putative methyltransferase-like protein n=1 Tax=Dinothrombium tinctorium TaxID=1965070 RepID=A0A3S3S9E9_9ACAR|nr:putative methyltransferase-like protein [Dinothrombium tinctorium]